VRSIQVFKSKIAAWSMIAIAAIAIFSGVYFSVLYSQINTLAYWLVAVERQDNGIKTKVLDFYIFNVRLNEESEMRLAEKLSIISAIGMKGEINERQDKLAIRLLNSGYNINAHDEKGQTPLLIAALNNRPNLIKWLLEKGADPNIKAIETKYKGQTPMEAIRSHASFLAANNPSSNEDYSEAIKILSNNVAK